MSDPAFSPHDRAARWRRFLAQLEQRKLDGFVLSNPLHLDYFFGFQPSVGAALAIDGQCDLIVDSRYLEEARRAPLPCRLTLATESIPETLRQRVRELPGPSRRIGFEAAFVSHQWALRLQDWNLPCQWVPSTGLAEELRLCKEPSELALLREAFAAAQEAYRRAVARLAPGMRETQAAAELEREMRWLGGEGTAFDTIVASGPRSSLPHGRASQRVIGEGDLTLIDFGLRWRSYCTDLTRIHLMPGGRPPAILPIVKEAQERALEAVRPGALTSDVDEAARGVIRRAGYGDFFGHGTGHGLGLEVHELPRISSRDPQPLRPGMVFTIEPGIYLPGRVGVRIEDVVAVTENGCQLLSDPDS